MPKPSRVFLSSILLMVLLGGCSTGGWDAAAFEWDEPEAQERSLAALADERDREAQRDAHQAPDHG